MNRPLSKRLWIRFWLECGRVILASRRWLDEGDFVRAAYRSLLNREPDEDGFSFYMQEIERKNIDSRGVLQSIMQSSEFKRLHGLAVDHLDALHQSRMMLVRRCLPSAEVIVDLGGSASGHRHGALLVMGYPYRPREIMIVDLADSQEATGTGGIMQSQTTDGIRITYYCRSMTDLSPIPDQVADLVWAGESIEHVTEKEVGAVCQEAYRVLKPGGYFCLDTPNASLTRLQSPDAFIHPEHKKEYRVHELRAELERWGFRVVEAKGVCPMPNSLRTGIFSYQEMGQSIGLSEDPEEAYLFYLKAIKPA